VNHDENDIFGSDDGLSDVTIDALLDGVAARYEKLTPEERDALRESVSQVERDHTSYAPQLDKLPPHTIDDVRISHLQLGPDSMSQMLFGTNMSDGHGCVEGQILQAGAIAQEAISTAKARAAGIIDDANKRAVKILDDARKEAHELQLIARKTLREAHHEADLAREQIAHAHSEVSALLEQARRYRDETRQAQAQQIATSAEQDRANALVSLRPVLVVGEGGIGKTRLADYLYSFGSKTQFLGDQVDLPGTTFGPPQSIELDERRRAVMERHSAFFDAWLSATDDGNEASLGAWLEEVVEACQNSSGRGLEEGMEVGDFCSQQGSTVRHHLADYRAALGCELVLVKLKGSGHDQSDGQASPVDGYEGLKIEKAATGRLRVEGDEQLKIALAAVKAWSDLALLRADEVLDGWYRTNIRGEISDVGVGGELGLVIGPPSKAVGS
jgi:cell division septum initiation protein DivIVA